MPRRWALAAAVPVALGLGFLALLEPWASSPSPIPAIAAEEIGPNPIPKRPNLVVIMTDDQQESTLPHMEHVGELLVDGGTTFASSYVSYSLCCPSRASFLTGQYAHNHGILGVAVPPAPADYEAMKSRLATDSVPLRLQAAGYDTAHVGKYLHGYGDYATPDPPPPGWTEWYGLHGIDSYYDYVDFTVNENGDLATNHGAYQTDVITRIATDYLRRRSSERDPFFLSIAYVAPHSGQGGSERCGGGAPPAPRHEGAFADHDLPSGPAINEGDVSDKPSEVRKLPRLDADDLDRARTLYQCQLEALLAVDEGVAEILAALTEHELANRTIVFFTSDNGLMQGEHRYVGKKLFPYEESLRVPLLVRGPGIAAQKTIADPVINVDLPATLLDLAGADLEATPALDGRSLVPLIRGGTFGDRELFFEAYFQNERSGDELLELFAGIGDGELRLTRWWNGETELYDLAEDPAELENVAGDPDRAAEVERLGTRLDELRGCRGTRRYRVEGAVPCP
jgi:N-acetylglucosamine-6-sulfatase